MIGTAMERRPGPVATGRGRSRPGGLDDANSSRLAAAMDILGGAAWFGLIVGWAELGLVLAQKALRDPGPLFFRMNRHVLWMVPAADLAIFVAFGLAAAVLALLRPRPAVRRSSGAR